MVEKRSASVLADHRLVQRSLRGQGCIKPVSAGRRGAAMDDLSGHLLLNPISLADAETATTAEYRRTEPSGATPGSLDPACRTQAMGPNGPPASLPEECP